VISSGRVDLLVSMKSKCQHVYEVIVRAPDDTSLYEMCPKCGDIRAVNGALPPIKQAVYPMNK
jgi:hypothetical protein